MKLIFAIVSNDDSNSVSAALNKESYQVTKLATTGGFLSMVNTTLIRFFVQCCRGRVAVVVGDDGENQFH